MKKINCWKKKEEIEHKLNQKDNEIETLKDMVRQIIIAKSKNMTNNNNVNDL